MQEVRRDIFLCYKTMQVLMEELMLYLLKGAVVKFYGIRISIIFAVFLSLLLRKSLRYLTVSTSILKEYNAAEDEVIL